MLISDNSETKVDYRKAAAMITLVAGVLSFYALTFVQMVTMALGDLSFAPFILLSFALVFFGGFYANQLLGPFGKFAATLLRWLVAAPQIYLIGFRMYFMFRATLIVDKRLPPILTDPIEQGKILRAEIAWDIIWSVGILIAVWPEIILLTRRFGPFRRPTSTPTSADTDSGSAQKHL